MKLSRESIGLAVRTAREAARMTLADLSAEVKLPVSSLSRLENGSRSVEFGEAIRICEAVGIDISSLQTLAFSLEQSGSAQKLAKMSKIQSDLAQLQRLAIESAIERSGR